MQVDLIEREAKLLEAGTYPDRGLEITEEELDAMAANTAEAPIRIEHTDTPFDGALGVLKSIYRRGKELFGKLLFTPAAWELIKAANAKRLSVAIKKDKSSIAEISLVRQPRIADAAVFSVGDAVCFDGCELPLPEDTPSFRRGPGGGTTRECGHSADLPLPIPPLKREGDTTTPCITNQSGEGEVERLKRELAEKEADCAIETFRRAGKLAPAAEPYARAMLLADDSSLIKFENGLMPVGLVFRRFLESQPKIIEFAELAPSDPNRAGEPEIFSKLGVTSEQVDKHRNR